MLQLLTDPDRLVARQKAQRAQAGGLEDRTCKAVVALGSLVEPAIEPSQLATGLPELEPAEPQPATHQGQQPRLIWTASAQQRFRQRSLLVRHCRLVAAGENAPFADEHPDLERWILSGGVERAGSLEEFSAFLAFFGPPPRDGNSFGNQGAGDMRGVSGRHRTSQVACIDRLARQDLNNPDWDGTPKMMGRILEGESDECAVACLLVCGERFLAQLSGVEVAGDVGLG